VNLFIPSGLKLEGEGRNASAGNGLPASGRTELTFESAPATPLALQIRCPGWAAGPVTFELNGQPLAVSGSPGSFARIERTWKAGDKLEVSIPMNLRTERAGGYAGQAGDILRSAAAGRVTWGGAEIRRAFPLSVSQTCQ